MPMYNVRKNFKDIFGVYLLESLSFEGDYDMPVVGCFDDISEIDYIALYSDLKEYNKTKNTCVCFYQYDHVFDGVHGLYNSIIYQDKKRLDMFRARFSNIKYIIGPDYSLFGDFPVALQIFNIYKSRICIAWLNKNTNAIVIPNVRWTLDFSYNYSFCGIMKGSNIAISLLGQIKNKMNKEMFISGFKKTIDIINPNSILVYGFVTESNFNEIFEFAKSKGINIIIPHSKIDKYKKGEQYMGQGRKFSSGLSTKGGEPNFITSTDISNGKKLAKDILSEMKNEGIKFSKDKIVFAIKLKNERKIFLETGGLEHIIKRHSNEFKKTFNVDESQIGNLLCNTISKGKLVSSKTKVVSGMTFYSNKYYYEGKYSIIYGIAENGYIETAYPKH